VSKKINLKNNIIISSNPRATFEKICKNFIKNYDHEELVDGKNLGFKKCGTNVKISKFSKIDKDVIFEDNIIVYKNTIIHQGSKISSGAIIGNLGLGPYVYKKKMHNCSHLGGVIIGNNSYIGASSLIARGTLNDTLIGKNVSIGNLVNIGHNVKIADNCIISSSVSVGGNVDIKQNTQVGIGSTLSPRIKIGPNCKIGINTNVVQNLNKNQSVLGNPAKKFFFLNKLF
jgi:UDP-3-O-[3-hydroxymyristoyl] glucosamine N-acyltransferase